MTGVGPRPPAVGGDVDDYSGQNRVETSCPTGFEPDFETAASRAVLEALRPYETWYVGGCVRDVLLGLPPSGDIDMATAAPPEEALRLTAGLGAQPVEGGLGALRVGGVELTSMRSEGGYSDRRRPDRVEFISSAAIDARRRDFTAGAIYWSSLRGIYDPFGGVADLEAGLLRAVGEPEKRFDEDPLRILRALRFASALGLEIEPRTAAGLRKMAPLLGYVSGERAAPELSKLLTGKNVFALLMEYGEVLSALIPEIRPALRCPQQSRFHCYGVWEHTARTVAAAPPEPLVRLAALLHDLGKPSCRRRDDGGADHFVGHTAAGAVIAARTARRLALTREETRELVTLVSLHDDRIRRRTGDVARLLGMLGEPATRRLIELRAADNAAKAPHVREPGRRAEMHRIVDEVLASGLPLTRGDLAVSGADVPAEGRMVGAALDGLLEAIWSGELVNERQPLLDHLHTMYDY